MKARVKFSKTASMKFVGHLDIMRYFQKAFRRAEIDVEYSKGFSPHQLISFAAPLGVGITSEAEYLDMQLGEVLSSKEMIEQINRAMVEGIQVVSFKALADDSKNAMSIVAAADYMVSVKDGYYVCEDFEKRIDEFLKQDEIKILKKTKKSENEVDIKPFIYEYGFERNEFKQKIRKNIINNNEMNKVDSDNTSEISTLIPMEEISNQLKNVIFMQVATGSVNNLKPDLVMEAFCESIGVTYNPFAFQVHRMEIYSLIDHQENQKLISLNDLGNEIL